jgi:hypothetical protein
MFYLCIVDSQMIVFFRAYLVRDLPFLVLQTEDPG